jgi:exodeoxyribonuclease V gamma subunit
LNHLLKSKVSHHVDDVIETLAKQGHWPVGFKGEDHLRQEYLNLKPFAEVVQSELGTETMHQDIKFKLDVDGIQVELEGNVKTYGSDKLVHYRHTNIKHKDRISALVHHLIANVQNKNIETVLMGWDKKKNLTERFTYHADDSKDDMEALLKLVIKGLKQPLPFFPETSLAIKKGGSYSMSAWKGGYMSTGERDDNAVSMCFGRDYPGHDEDISEAFYNISAELLIMLEKWEVQS